MYICVCRKLFRQVLSLKKFQTVYSMEPQFHLVATNVSSSLQNTDIDLITLNITGSSWCGETGPAIDDLHQWFHPAAFEQSPEPATLRASKFLSQSRL